MDRTVKIKYLILLGIVLTGLAYGHYQYGIFTKYNFLTGQIDKMNNKYQLVVYGETASDDMILNIAARDFKFQYKFIGCIISTPAIHGIDGYNSVMKNQLTRLNGKGWEEKFMLEVEKLKEQ
jgi:hypothetical protein